MPDTEQEQGQNRVIDLKAGAHVMMLDAGVFCVFHAPGQSPSGDSGLPGVRISRAPGVSADVVEVSTFEPDGWMGGTNSAALVRVHQGPSGVLVTTYQEVGSTQPGPRLQVMRLTGETADAKTSFQEKTGHADASSRVSQSDNPEESDVTAHVQRHGDVSGVLGKWVGTPGSQLWVEGFSINVAGPLKSHDVEYQAVLGRGWLSPWVEGGEFCGSRGMSLPILGLRVRLKGEAASRWSLRMSAAFTDGTRLGPIDGSEEALEAESLAPLEGFCLELVEKEGGPSSSDAEKGKKSAARRAVASSTTRKVDKRRTRR